MVQQCFYHRRQSSTLRVITHPPIQSIRPTSIHLWWDFCNPSPLPRCQQQTAVTCPPPSDGRTTWSWLCCWGRGTSCSPSSASTSTPATTSTGRSFWSTSGVWKLAQFRSLHISVQHPKPFFLYSLFLISLLPLRLSSASASSTMDMSLWEWKGLEYRILKAKRWQSFDKS